MGTLFDIKVSSDDRSGAAVAIEEAFAEVSRLESLMSSYKATSDLSRVNNNAGIKPLVVSEDLFRVVKRSVEISELTDGAFDITYAGCGYLWSVKNRKIPSQLEIKACLPLVDFKQIILEPPRLSIYLSKPNIKIGVGGLGKGYAVDRAAEVLLAKGFKNFIVNGGGDIRISGRHPNRPWQVGIADPRVKHSLLGSIPVESGAVVSSGDYERFFEEDGVRYHHIIDPITGSPARKSIAVTVLSENAMNSDGLSTALFVLGPDAGIRLVEGLDGVEALIIAPDQKVYTSTGFPDFRD